MLNEKMDQRRARHLDWPRASDATDRESAQLVSERAELTDLLSKVGHCLNKEVLGCGLDGNAKLDTPGNAYAS